MPHPTSPAPSSGFPGTAGRIETGLASRGSLRWAAADLGPVLEEARRRHDLSPAAAVALGRSLAGATLLLHISLRSARRIVLEVVGDGPLGKVVAEATDAGHLRGRVENPHVPTPEDGRMRIAPLLGSGILRVTRLAAGAPESSQVDLVSGELGDDLTHFLEQSEQIRSAVLLGVLPKPTGIAAAGGLVVEALPGTEAAVLRRLEANIRAIDGVSRRLERGGAGALAASVLEGLGREEGSAGPLDFHCECSRAALRRRLLPIAVLQREALFDGEGRCEARCAFCGDRYEFHADELLSSN